MKPLMKKAVVLLIVFAAISICSAQVQEDFKFGNGIEITLRQQLSFVEDTLNVALLPISNMSADKKTLHRILIDKKNRRYFGYDLAITKGPGEKSYVVSWKPLSIEIFTDLKEIEGFEFVQLMKSPSTSIVNNADLIVTNVLVNPETKKKLSEILFFRAGIFAAGKNPGEITVLAPKDFTIDDVSIGIDRATIKINGKVIEESNASVWGQIVYVYIPGKGRFIFSPFDRKRGNFNKEAIVISGIISFKYGGDDYVILSQKAVLDHVGGEVFNLWVMFDPDYKPSAKFGGPDTFSYGAAGSVDALLDTDWNQEKR